jgi:hypothetical protein
LAKGQGQGGVSLLMTRLMVKIQPDNIQAAAAAGFTDSQVEKMRER